MGTVWFRIEAARSVVCHTGVVDGWYNGIPTKREEEVGEFNAKEGGVEGMGVVGREMRDGDWRK